MAHQLGHALHQAFGLGLLTPHHQAALVLGQSQPGQQVSLAAARGTTVADDVGLAVVRHGLRPGQRAPGRVVDVGRQQAGQLGALLVGEVALKLAELDLSHFGT